MVLMFAGLAMLIARAQNAAAPAPPAAVAGQTVAGRVVSSADGHPIAKASITLAPQIRAARRQGGGPGATPLTAQTDADGRYQLTAPAAGRFTLRATAPGYLGSLYLEHEGFSSAIVTGAGVPTDNLVFTLLPEASLHGRVLDDSGEPVRGSVTLYRDSTDRLPQPGYAESAPRIRPAGGTQTDEDGQYEFNNLQPGRYYVAVTAAPWYAVHPQARQNEDRMPYRSSIDPATDVAYPITFYPHATTEQAAVPIVLKAGGRSSANMVLQAEPALTLTVQMPPADGSPQGGRQAFPVLFSKVFGSEQGVAASNSGRMGDTVVISGLAPGQYAMREMGRREGLGSEVPVTLSSGSATVGLPASAAAATDLSITLRTAAGAPLEDAATVLLRRTGNGRLSQELPPGKVEQGVAHFADLPPGQYRIVVQEDGEAWNVSRLAVAGKVVASKLLRLDGSPVQAEVTVSKYAPEVEGEVHVAGGAVHPGSLVVLVPAGADTGEDLYRLDQSDLDGGFQFYNVLPGNYLLIALDNHWKLDWRNTAELLPYLQQALPVTVPASGPAVVRLREAAIVQGN